jgi:hypothetical protein
MLPPGWGEEFSISVMSTTTVDATAEPGDDAKLTVVSLLCGTTVVVPPGTRVQLSGGDVMGSHRIDVEPSEAGPELRLQLIPILGSIKVRAASE